jgi:hypothetical protein
VSEHALSTVIGDVGGHTVDLDTAKRYVLSVLNGLLDRGYYADAFGYTCAREGRVFGYAGADLEAYARVLGGPHVWPPGDEIDNWELGDLVRVVQFYYRDVAEPTRYRDHTAYGCGLHPNEFSPDAGRAEFRGRMNEVLRRLEPSLELAELGDIHPVISLGLSSILGYVPTGNAAARYAALIGSATSKFARATSAAEQKDAVRDLADLLEELRPDARRLFGRPDEAALFNIANNFAIRHRNLMQRVEYEQSVWMPWIFYWYLASVHAIVAALERENADK